LPLLSGSENLSDVHLLIICSVAIYCRSNLC
jgi:hypothetical protein